jgi:hypothetical protein
MRKTSIVAGAGAGVAATVSMTWVMAALHREQPEGERDALPPREIAERATQVAGVDDQLTPAAMDAISLAAHLAYGASTGAVFGALASRPRGHAHEVARGTAFGIAVFAASYLGWLPALRLQPRVTRWSAERLGLMVAAHVVWGAALGGLKESLLRAQKGTTRRELPSRAIAPGAGAASSAGR